MKTCKYRNDAVKQKNHEIRLEIIELKIGGSQTPSDIDSKMLRKNVSFVYQYVQIKRRENIQRNKQLRLSRNRNCDEHELVTKKAQKQ